MSGRITKLDPAQLDRVSGGSRPAGSGDHDSITGGDGADNVAAGYGNDTVDGGGGGDYISGGMGADQLRGGEGDDFVMGDTGNDTVFGNAGQDRVDGGYGDDVLGGGTGQDTVLGGEGNDTILWHPGDGHDTVVGGNGTDTLRLEDTGMTLQQLFDNITYMADGGNRSPQLMDGYIDLTGVRGFITIGHETINFSEMERLVVGGYTFMPGRGD